MIYAKEKSRKSLLVEFKEHLPDKYKTEGKYKAEELIDDVLKPHAKALATVRNTNYEATDRAKEVNDHLRWLNLIDNSDWIPVAIKFLSEHKNEPKYVDWFFERLERLAAYMHICARNVNQRIERYSKVIKALESDTSLNDPVHAVELTDVEKKRMRTAIDGNIYELTPKRRSYLILRLDSFISDGGAKYEGKVLTIEHVLPQTVPENSEWAKLWPDEQEREKWIHRIANLVPLNKSRNSKAQNYDFAEKKKNAYFNGNKDGSSYALTSQVSIINQWTPQVVKNRQRELLEKLQEKWRLQ
jgi:hypothetical protein